MKKVTKLRTPAAASVTKRDLFALDAAIQSVAGVAGSVKWVYAVERTRQLIQPVIETIRKAAKPVDGAKDYEAARLALCRKFAAKDQDGEPVTNANQFVIGDPTAFAAASAALRKDHADTIAQMKTQESEVEALLDEPAEVKLHTVSMNRVPDGLTPAQMRALWPMIEVED